MKPRSPILFHLLTGITICWLALSTVRADTELPASGYSPRSGELTAREMTIAKTPGSISSPTISPRRAW